jgi:hypothetical protein
MWIFMPPEQKISDAAVEKATGHDWAHWMGVLENWGAKKRPHKQIAAYLQEEHGLSPWWAQTVTVEYEKDRGLRKTGQVAGGGYQVGVTKTLDLTPEEAWKRFMGSKGLVDWLGQGAPKKLQEGQEFTLEDGAQVQVRVVKPGSHVRLFWQPPDWKKRSVLQVRLVERAGERTAVTFHHEDLPQQKSREEMRAHWKARLEALT